MSTKTKKLPAINQKDAMLWVNLVFFGVAILLLFYYVTIANSITAKNYKLQTLRENIESLTETNGFLMSKKLSLESPSSLYELAKLSNLVEAKNIVYIFENKSVARR